MREVNYLCCSKTHVENYEKQKERLAEMRSRVVEDIEEAKIRNAIVDDHVQRWLAKVDEVIEEGTRTRKKWFHQYLLENLAKKIRNLMLEYELQKDHIHFERRSSTFKELAEALEKGDYIHFESRETGFKELVEALEKGDCNMIGLAGLLEGIGKTTLAKQVGKESKAFQKVIFTAVSKTPDIKKIQAEIAKQLGLSLEEREEAEHSKILLSRIANSTGRLLIILDDIWAELDLRDIGIPLNHHNCCVLVTTRNAKVCEAMRCQLTIHLHKLTDKESFNIFKKLANLDYLPSIDLDEIAQEIVKECGGLPFALVTIARALINRPVAEWKSTLATLRNSQPSVDVGHRQYLLEKAEVLELWGNEETRRTSLVPGIIPIKYGVMNELMKLCLYEFDDIEHLIDVGVNELCGGPIPSGFLGQLQVLKLSRCMQLRNIFHDGSLELPHLKVLHLELCPMVGPFIFKRSLLGKGPARLEELVIEDCNELTSLIEDESSGEENSYDGLFPGLQTLKINGCEKLKVVSPVLLARDLPVLRHLSIRYCGKLSYIFHEYRHEGQFLHLLTLLPSLSTIDLYWVPSMINILRECKNCMQKPPPKLKHDSKKKHAIPWALGCCFGPQL